MNYLVPRLCGLALGISAGLLALLWALPSLHHFVKNNIALQKESLALLGRLAHPLSAFSLTVAFWLHTAPVVGGRDSSNKRAFHVASFVGLGATLKPALALIAAGGLALVGAFFWQRGRARAAGVGGAMHVEDEGDKED